MGLKTGHWSFSVWFGIWSGQSADNISTISSRKHYIRKTVEDCGWTEWMSNRVSHILYTHAEALSCPEGCQSFSNAPPFMKTLYIISSFFSITEQTLTWHQDLRAGVNVMQTLMRKKIMIQTVKRDSHWEENYDSESQVRADRALALHCITALTSQQESHLKYELAPVVFSLFSQ